MAKPTESVVTRLIERIGTLVFLKRRLNGGCKTEEYHCSLAMVVWGGWLLLPYSTFASPVYRWCAEIAPEVVWGVVFVLLGTTHAWVIWINDLKWRRYFSFWGGLWWLTLSLLCVASYQTAVAGAMFFTFFVASIFNYIENGRRGGDGQIRE